jgi:pimeloyl-ACP methyl ester carboxylesterase
LNSLSEVVKLGTGPVPVILIPEYRKDWSIFQDYVERNLTKYTFYAITLPGYHRTNPYPLPVVYDFSNRVWLNSVAEGVISLIQNEKLERPLLVGALNAGSYVATRVASRVPDQVRGIVLLNGALREGTDEKSFNMSATQRSDQVNGDFSSIIWYLLTRYTYSESELDGLMTRNLPSSHPIFYYTLDTLKVKRVYRMHHAFPSLTERYDLEWLTADLAEDVKRLRVPMLVVLSIYDSAWPFEPAMNHLTGQWKKFVLENELENIRITEIENARLVLMLEAPDIVGKAIDAFLENKVVPSRYLH